MNASDQHITINFHKKRDAGQIMTTSFQFFRLYYKPLFKGIFFFCFPFFVLAMIFFGTAFNEIFMLILNSAKKASSQEIKSIFASFGLIILGALLFFTGIIFLTNVVNELIRFVVQNKGQAPSIQELWTLIKKKFWITLANFLIWYVLSGIIISVVQVVLMGFFGIAGGVIAAGAPVLGGLFMLLGTLCLFFVVIYYNACTLPMFFISTYENKNVIEALGRSITLFHAKKANFWGGILVNLLSIVMMYLFYMMLSVPVSIVFGIIQYNSGNMQWLESEAGIMRVLMVVYGLLLLLAPLSTIISFASSAFKYFDMSERADGTGLKERIKLIGKSADFEANAYEQPY